MHPLLCKVKLGQYELDCTKISSFNAIKFNACLLLNGFWPGSKERYTQYLFDTVFFFDLLQKI